MSEVIDLSPGEIRVLGALMEKARTTPEYYPMTLNGLTHACNQKTSRDPVTDYEEHQIMSFLDELRDKGLVYRVDVAGSRVPKFKQVIEKAWELDPQEYAILTLLFLRGPQTVGQLRQRAERIHPFDSIKEVESTLDRLRNREEEPFQLVRQMHRRSGREDIRHIHVFYPDSETREPEEPPREDVPEQGDQRVEELENRVRELENTVAELRDFMQSLQ